MNLLVGDKVRYSFPNPGVLAKKEFTGMIDFVGETFITLKNESNTLLKITSKNFHLIEPETNMNYPVSSASENYYG